MAISVVMPALEMAQETGKVLAWRKKEGEQVTKGEPLLEIETDKAVVEVEAPGDGLLAGVAAKVGDEIPVGRTIAWLVKPGEQPPADSHSQTQSGRANTSGVSATPVAGPAATIGAATTAPQISPKARRLAKELGVDFTAIRGTGPDGVITAEDVQAFAGASKAAPAPTSTTEQLNAVARLMAERTTQSWTQVPHFFVSREVDCTELQKVQARLAEEIQRKHGARLTITDFLVALVARVLARHPRVNAIWKDGTILANPYANISVAMAVEGGVINAVIHNADKAQLVEICAKRQELTELARANRLRPADIQGGTFTISNLGMYKVDAFTAIIPPGQSAILAVGAIADRVVAINGNATVRPMMSLTLSSDHRAIDGARAALFLGELVDAISAPGKWLE
jgi:pyruvate dehydrogenase E2 component (dihydrolipoamide acetyltransferase)